MKPSPPSPPLQPADPAGAPVLPPEPVEGVSRPTWRGEAIVFGEAAAQGSKTAYANKKGGRPIMVDADKKLKSWRGQLQAEMDACAPPSPLDETVWVFLTVYVSRPRSHYGTGRNAGVLKPTAPLLPKSGKDLDKIARAVGDAGSRIWWTDDSRIAAWTIFRLYDARERTLVRAGLMTQAESVERRVSQIVTVRG